MEANAALYFLLASSVGIGVLGCVIAWLNDRAHKRDRHKGDDV